MRRCARRTVRRGEVRPGAHSADSPEVLRIAPGRIGPRQGARPAGAPHRGVKLAGDSRVEVGRLHARRVARSRDPGRSVLARFARVGRRARVGYGVGARRRRGRALALRGRARSRRMSGLVVASLGVAHGGASAALALVLEPLRVPSVAPRTTSERDRVPLLARLAGSE